ncbi:MAG: hypothetical protein A2X20_01885 [Bacteroidetes bacterium GWE2_40_15]|nr:MAG: hypothetical protein A2X20_01885 [Bacteroidetes bacterium GWE2_40_15]
MRKLYILMFFLGIVSCNIKEGSSSISVDLDQSDKVSIFDLADSISIVQLETTNESLIKYISNVIPYKNRFYVFDKLSQVVLCFSSNGQFLFKINKKGRGPEEYENVASFNIDNINDQILLLVPWGYVLTFDLDGNFISKKKLPEEIKSYNEVFAVNRDTLLFLSSNEYRAIYYSRKSDSIINKCLGVDEMPEIEYTKGVVYMYNDSLYFSSAGFDNKVLNMSHPERRVAYNWDFGKNNFTQKQISNEMESRLKAMNEKKQYLIFDNFGDDSYPTFYRSLSLETDRFEATSVLYKIPFSYLCVFRDKIDGKVNVFRETIEGIQFSYFLAYNNLLILRNNGKNKYYSEGTLSPKQLEIVKSHNPDTDNPFLVIYHLM